jgi:hypothetical protein
MWTDAEILVAAQAMLQRQTENTHTPLNWSDLTPNSQAGYISDARCAMDAVERYRRETDEQRGVGNGSGAR